MSKPVFCLMGPTASGKTALACELVQQFPLEIISVDSAMIYRGMDIGTAKPDHQVLANAPHHLIDIIDPPDSYSAARFCDEVITLCRSIYSRGKLPLLVGGTMMYVRALQQGLSCLPEADEAIREQLLQQAQVHGWEYMHQTLTRLDPISAARIHPNDTQRIQRALEVYQLTGQSLSDYLRAETKSPDLDFVNLILMPEQREWLHQRIAWRFQQMLAAGFLDEVEQLVTNWHLTLSSPSMRSVGYRQALAYLQGEYDYSSLQEKGVAATRQLAKRQLTWLRHWPEGNFLAADNPHVITEIMAIIKRILDNSEQ